MTDPHDPTNPQPNSPKDDDILDVEALPVAEPIGDGDSSILFESPEIPPMAGPDDPFAHLPDPSSGASFAMPWDQSVQGSSPTGEQDQQLLYDSVSDKDLLRFVDEEVIEAQAVENTVDEHAAIHELPPGSHGSSVVPLGSVGRVSEEDSGSLLLDADDILIIDDDLPPIDEQTTHVDEVIPAQPADYPPIAEVVEESEDAELDSLPTDLPSPSKSSIIDILLGEEAEIGEMAEELDSMELPPVAPKPRLKPTPVDDDEDAFAIGHMAEAIIEEEGPTTGIKISDEIALSELDRSESPSMTNLGAPPSAVITDSHISKFVDEDWRSSRDNLHDVSGSMVPLGGNVGKRPIIEAPSEVSLGEDEAAAMLADDMSTEINDDVDLSEEAPGDAFTIEASDLGEPDESWASSEEATSAEPEPEPVAAAPNKWEQRAAKKAKSQAAVAEPAPTTSKGKSRGGALAGTVFGLVLGAGGFAGAYFGGFLPADPNELLGVVSNSPRGGPQPPISTPTPIPTPTIGVASVDEGQKLLDLGNPSAALAAFTQLDANDAKVLLGRGQSRWLVYLQERAKTQAKLEAMDEAVIAAKDELTNAAAKMGDENDTAPAMAKLWLGLIAESLGDLDTARQIYREGGESFSKFAQPFQAGLNRLELQAPPAATPHKVGGLPPREALLGFVILLQDAPAPMAQASDEEPGFKFWEALVLARRHQYGEAQKALVASRTLHDRRRLESPGKRLNPTSDPLEQIFLRCCDELGAYWKVREGFYANPMLAAQIQQKGFETVLKDITTQLDVLSVTTEKLKTVKLENRPLPEAIDELIKLRKQGDDLLTKLSSDLKDAGFDEPKIDESLGKALASRKLADDKLKEIAKHIKDGGVDEPDTAKAVLLLTGARKDLGEMLGAVTERLLAAKVLEGNVDRAKLETGLDVILSKANTPGLAELVSPSLGLLTGATAPAGDSLQIAAKLNKAIADVKAMQDQLAKAKSSFQTEMDAMVKRQEQQLAAVRTPAKTLDLWLAILSNPDRKGEVAPANDDASSVLKDEKAAPDVKAKALAVTGLAARNTGDFAGARKSLESVLKHPGFDANSAWGKDIVVTVEELRNPGKEVRREVPRPSVNAVAAIDQMLTSFPADQFPKEHGQLLAKRALQRIETGDLLAAKADAEAAVKANVGSEGFFALARVAEKLEDFALAEKNYREVLKQKDADPVILKEARFGLARSIIEQRRPLRLLGPATGANRPREASPELAMTLFVVLLQQPDGVAPPKPLPGEEALQLAEELLKDGDKRGHFLKADVLLQREQFTDALREYSAGLRAAATPPPELRGLLDEIISRHPNLRKPEPRQIAEQEAAAKAARNPPLANKEYGAGCTHYYAGRYAEAEQAFARAVGLDNLDARYSYFLGLARWMQGNTVLAENDFQVAAALESQGKPNRRVVNESLERIQGDLRTTIDRFRP